jgi:predicted  nucleic acid-binding Zn-ribbon protein
MFYDELAKELTKARKSLVVKALEESIEELCGEIDFLKGENKRLRNVSRATRTTNRKIRKDVTALVEQVEEMGQHIMNIAVEEQEDLGSTSASEPTT